jgi:hypothetical protein
MTNIDTIPTLEAVPVDGCTDQWKVWCQYCKAWHYHGAVEGHRWAHCHQDSSPYLKTGYIIKCASVPECAPSAPEAHSITRLSRAVATAKGSV